MQNHRVHQRLTHEDEIALGKIIQEKEGDPEAKARAVEKLIVHNTKLAIKFVVEQLHLNGYDSSLTVEDLLQEALIGLRTAALKFEPERGCKFSTFATWYIRAALQRTSADNGDIIRIPVHAQGEKTRVRKARKRLEENGNKVPTLTEIAQEADIPVKAVERVLETGRVTAHLEDFLNTEHGGGNLHDVISASKDEGVQDEEVIRKQIINDVRAVIAAEPNERDKQVVKMFFGLYGYKREYTMEEIAAAMEISRQRVQQILKKKIKKLQRVKKFQEHRSSNEKPGEIELRDSSRQKPPV